MPQPGSQGFCSRESLEGDQVTHLAGSVELCNKIRKLAVVCKVIYLIFMASLGHGVDELKLICITGDEVKENFGCFFSCMSCLCVNQL